MMMMKREACRPLSPQAPNSGSMMQFCLLSLSSHLQRLVSKIQMKIWTTKSKAINLTILWAFSI